MAALFCNRAHARALGDPVAAAWPQDLMAPGPFRHLSPSPLGSQGLASFPHAVPGAPPPDLAELWRDARVGAQNDATVPRVLDIDPKTPDYSAIARFLGNTGPVPKLARDVNGKFLLIYSSSSDANTTQLSSTNPNTVGDDMTPLSLESLARWTPRLATQGGAAGVALRAGSGSSIYTFVYWGTYRDAQRNVTCTLLADSAHATSIYNTTILSESNMFGDYTFRQVWAAAAGETAPAFEPPALSADGESLNVLTASVGEVANYLRNRSAPALGYSKIGRPFFVEDAGQGQVNVTDFLTAGPYAPVKLQAFVETFTFLDSGRMGNGTVLFADQAAGNVTARAIMRLHDVHSVDGTVMLEVNNAAGAANLSLSAFRQVFGEAGMQAMQAGILSDPAVPPDAVGVGYKAASANATLWPVHPNPAMVSQSGLRDSYFLAVIAAQLNAYPAYVYNMIRPSTDGNPWHSDARFFDPQGFYFRPFTVTVKNVLPTVNGSAVSEPYFEGGTESIAIPMLEEAFAVANEQLHMKAQGAGLGAIQTGDAGLAMQMVTGNAPRVHPTYFFTGDEIRHILDATNNGYLVILGTPESNGPGPLSKVVSGLIESQSYAVMNTTTDARNDSWVHLFNPLRAYAPDGHGGLSVTSNGSFALRLDDVRRGFSTIFYGPAGW